MDKIEEKMDLKVVCLKGVYPLMDKRKPSIKSVSRNMTVIKILELNRLRLASEEYEQVKEVFQRGFTHMLVKREDLYI